LLRFITTQSGETYPGGLRCSPRTSLSGLAAKLIVVEEAATLSRCEFVLYLAKPTHPQGSDAIYDLANLFAGVFWQIHRDFRFEPNGENAIAEVDKEAPAGGWGAFGLGLLDFREILIPRSSLQLSATELGSNSCLCSIGKAAATDSGCSL
jgi:hypothetical protein